MHSTHTASLRRTNVTLALGLTALVTFAGSTAFVPVAAAQGNATPAASASATEARPLIQRAADLVKAMTGATFAVENTAGGAGLTMGGKADIRFVRDTASPEKRSSYAATGTLNVPMLAENQLNFALIRGETIQWIDDQAKKLMQRPAGMDSVNPGMAQAKRTESLLLPPFLIAAEPFKEELDMVNGAGLKMTIEGEELIGGVPCHKILVVIKENSKHHRLWLAKDSGLPLAYEQIRNPNSGAVARKWTLSAFTPDAKLTHDDLMLKAPEGYASDVNMARATPQPTVNDLPARPPEPTISAGGPQFGQAAPVIVGKQGAADFSNESLLGSPAVVVFWSPIMTAGNAMIQTAAKAAADSKAKLVIVACRTETLRDGELARAVNALNLSDATIVTNGDGSMRNWNIRGFPSVAVLTSQARVAAFFEGTATEQELADALKAK
jgi:hypothetical protein